MHHSGLLPILKEVIEILFQEGFIKVGRRILTKSYLLPALLLVRATFFNIVKFHTPN